MRGENEYKKPQDYIKKRGILMFNGFLSSAIEIHRSYAHGTEMYLHLQMFQQSYVGQIQKS